MRILEPEVDIMGRDRLLYQTEHMAWQLEVQDIVHIMNSQKTLHTTPSQAN